MNPFDQHSARSFKQLHQKNSLYMKSLSSLNPRTILRAGAVTATAFSFAAGAHADVITPTGATTTNTQDAYVPVTSIFNGNGLNATPTDANVLTVTHNSNNYSGNNFASTGGVLTLNVTLDLGSAVDLTQIYLWNMSQPGEFNKGSQNINISTSLTSGGVFTSAGSITLAQATANPTTTQAFALVASNVQFVRLDVTSNYGSTTSTGLGEVRFDAVPEPGTLVALAAGFGVLGLVRRRRSS